MGTEREKLRTGFVEHRDREGERRVKNRMCATWGQRKREKSRAECVQHGDRVIEKLRTECLQITVFWAVEEGVWLMLMGWN